MQGKAGLETTANQTATRACFRWPKDALRIGSGVIWLIEAMPKWLPFRLADYLELVDWTGRVIRDDKRGAITDNLPPILERLQIDPRYWFFMTEHFESRFKGLVGAAYTLKSACVKLGYQRTPNLAVCSELLSRNLPSPTLLSGSA